MPSCQCAGSSCSCLLQAGPGLTVDGVGSKDRPYVISSVPYFAHEVVPIGTTAYTVGILGTRSVLSLDFQDDTVSIELPGGGSVAPPPLGSELEIDVNGQPGGSYTFSGPVVSWRGGAPGAETRGLYRFVLASSYGGLHWIAQYIGAS